MIMSVISDDQMREKKGIKRETFLSFVIIDFDVERMINWCDCCCQEIDMKKEMELEWDNGLMANESVKNIKQIITFKL